MKINNKTLELLNKLYIYYDIKSNQCNEYILQCKDKIKLLNQSNKDFNNISNKLKEKENILLIYSKYMKLIKLLITNIENNNITINYTDSIESCLDMFEHFCDILYSKNNELNDYKNSNNISLSKEVEKYSKYASLSDFLVTYYINNCNDEKNNLSLS